MTHRLHFNRPPKLPVILQDEIAECGHACVAMVSQFFGNILSLHELRKINKPALSGVSLRDIKSLLEQLHLKSRALRVPLGEVQYIKTPAILHWNMNHFVVLKRVKKNKIIIHDPAIGMRTCSYEEFSQSFTGIALEIEKSEYFKTIRSKKKLSLREIIKTISGIYYLLGILLFLSMAIELLSLVNPLLIQYVTDQLISANSLSNLYTIALAFILFVALHTLAEYTRAHLVLYTTTHFTENLSANVFKHLLSLPTEFFEHRHQGDIQSKFQSIQQIQSKISTDFINTLLDGMMFVFNLVIMFLYSGLLTMIVLLALFMYVILRYSSYQTFKNQMASSIHLHAKVSSIFLETTRAITPIKLFVKENMRFNTWRNSHIDALNADIQISKKNIVYRTANLFVFNLEHILIICTGAKLVIINQLSIGMLLAFLAYRYLLVSKSSSLIQNIFDYQLISIQLNRLSDILFQQPESTTTVKHDNKIFKSMLTLVDVSFRYNASDKLILKHVSFDIQAGEKVVITGPSGCGKSTVLKIMIGLLSPTSGQMLIDDVPLKKWDPHHYRQIIAAVMQDDVLLTGSILDNITFFDEDIDLEYVHQVAKWANIHESILALPMKYESLVGEMGSMLSGGQKQRLLLARALYKKPKILFLDEATSHLDHENEILINNTLKSLNITQIMVAHRQETIHMADRVIDLAGHASLVQRS